MGKTIVIANQKGGVGKSTIACNLAVAFSKDSYKTMLIDTDTQESSISFRVLRQTDDIQAISITKPTIHKDVTSFNHDIIIIDVGGRDSSTFRSAIMAGGYGIVLIPVLPSVYDIWATQDTLEVIKEARSYTNIDAYLIVNQVIRANIVKESLETLEELTKEYDVKILNTKLHSRIAYRNSIKEGKGVLELNDEKAKSELYLLYKEIKEKVGVA